MNERKALEALHRAAERRRVAEDERHAASTELRKRVRDAHAAGVSPTRIAGRLVFLGRPFTKPCNLPDDAPESIA